MASSGGRASAKSSDNNPSPTTESVPEYDQFGHGHYFTKKTFHKPTYCHHCADMLWGLIGQGCICEVCNFVVHDRCLKTVVSPCSTVASNVIKNPVPHCWTDVGHLKRKFCNVCRKRIEDSSAVRCETCEYCVHLECQDFSVADCKECATYVPDQDLTKVVQYHHWREGNLPPNSKCHYCKKTCWSAECLAGMRCEWCGWTAHAICYKNLSPECNFGVVQSIMLPPYCVSIPRTDVPLETIIGVQNKRKTESGSPRSASEEFSAQDQSRQKDIDEYPSPKDKDKDEEIIKVYDGNSSMRRRTFRTITVSRSATKEQIICAALRAFHIHDDPRHYIITDFYDANEREIPDFMPVQSLLRREGKRPAIFFRFKPPNPNEGTIRVYPGRLNVNDTYRVIPVTNDTSVDDVMIAALNEFGLDAKDINRHRLVEVSLDKGAVHERTMDNQECPWEIIKNVARSVKQKENTRFYLQTKDEVYCSNVAVFVGNLPPNLNQRQYEKILVDVLGKPYKYRQVGPIYYEYGSLIITYDNADIAVKAFYMLRDATYDDKNLLVLLLPNIVAEMIPPGVRPLLVFVNVKSGGCQGLELISSFRKLLNPYQVYDLENGGPLPGLYVFRHVKDYKILVCGGDGTVGWVLQCLDNVGQDSECQSPPCAVVPLGTGNDLARVLRWGSGYTGGEDPLTVLKDVIDAEEIRLDRWTVVFHTDEAVKSEDKPGLPANSSGSTSEDNTAIYVMNNYFGIGIDADLCLGFHNAREENPDKFNSRYSKIELVFHILNTNFDYDKKRFHNKGVYVKMGLRKMVSRKSWKDLHKEIRLEVDGKVVNLPPLEGIIILNILSWGSGANPWGPEKEDQFSKPTHYDGMLEIVGVTGIVHMGQIQSGLRSAIRIAQGGHIRIRINTEMPVQVDGEPWIQTPGEVVVLKSALKATMLRKTKMKRRNTEPVLTATEKSSIERSSIALQEKSSISERPDE
ncbi:diacylglycerol kinase theta-like protein [Dinothrombium tinctorium]|uniref:Diacylglycerol kinase n=1 Tax=Dinothrombium tinctorium TaxID=1965070 RepID=A0A3S3PJU7_9ACAR|nr:diacylglycerol kinase theta-like protein [Dinothrombium tinctorium]RWS14113.1 diacylglycerol kinase theta-like protein [Dinothrombium tinctorium]